MPDPQSNKKVVKAGGAMIAFPASMPDHEISAAIKKHKSVSIPSPNDTLQQVLTEYPGLARNFNAKNTAILFATPERSRYGSEHNGDLEFWPSSESGTKEFPNPMPGKNVLEIYNSDLRANPKLLRKAIYGDLMHGMVNDPYWKGLRTQFMQNFTPQELQRQKERKTWWDDVNGSKDQFGPTYDAYIRGWLANEGDGRKGQIQSKNTMYSPKQLQILQSMEQYLKTGRVPNSHSQSPHELKSIAVDMHGPEWVPPAVERIEDAVKPKLLMSGSLGDAIASVAKNEPHVIEVNDPKKFSMAPKQAKSHEIVHLYLNQLPGPLRNAVPSDDPKHPYYIGDVDQLRAQGKRLWQLPQEKAAALVQRYVADPSSRRRLQPWIDDLSNAPLSVGEPTGPNDKEINMAVRIPPPPVESYQYLEDLKKEAQRRKPTVVK